MFIRLQTASAVLLLVLASIFGQPGILQCLCTGQVSVGSQAVEKCALSCCQKHGEAPGHNQEWPSPCEDGSCYLLITLEAINPPETPATTPVLVASSPAAFAEWDLSAPWDLAEPPSLRRRPPDRPAVPLTVLFSSFLI